MKRAFLLHLFLILPLALAACQTGPANQPAAESRTDRDDRVYYYVHRPDMLEVNASAELLKDAVQQTHDVLSSQPHTDTGERRPPFISVQSQSITRPGTDTNSPVTVGWSETTSHDQEDRRYQLNTYQLPGRPSLVVLRSAADDPEAARRLQRTFADVLAELDIPERDSPPD